MEKGYYIPETNEFCEGFELEIKYTIEGPWEKQTLETYDMVGSDGGPGGFFNQGILYNIFYSYLKNGWVLTKQK